MPRRPRAKTRSTSSSERTSHSVDQWAGDGLGEIADILLDALALERERQLAPRPPRAPARSPTRSSGCSRRPEPGPSCLRISRPRLASLKVTLSEILAVGSAHLRVGSSYRQLLVALVATPGASAALVRIRPRLRRDRRSPASARASSAIPRQQARGRDPRDRNAAPAAARAPRSGSAFAFAGPFRRLDVRRPAPRALSRHARRRPRRVAVAQVSRAIPARESAGATRSCSTASRSTLPVAKLPALGGLRFVQKIYPSVRYHLAIDTSTSVIGATELQTLTGAKGDGIKIGIVDDGVDSTNPFLNPAGYSVPGGLPEGRPEVDDAEGDRRARVSRARTRAAPGRLPIDREASFHATHVAGIAAGDAGTCSPGGRDHPPTCGPVWRRAARVDRQLPRLQRADADRPRRQHARDRGGLRGRRARRHGRHQLLRRRRRDRACQRRDDRGDPQRRGRRRRAGDLGGQRPRRLRPRHRRVAGHGARRDHGRGRLEHARSSRPRSA